MATRGSVVLPAARLEANGGHVAVALLHFRDQIQHARSGARSAVRERRSVLTAPSPRE